MPVGHAATGIVFFFLNITTCCGESFFFTFESIWNNHPMFSMYCKTAKLQYVPWNAGSGVTHHSAAAAAKRQLTLRHGTMQRAGCSRTRIPWVHGVMKFTISKLKLSKCDCKRLCLNLIHKVFLLYMILQYNKGTFWTGKSKFVPRHAGVRFCPRSGDWA